MRKFLTFTLILLLTNMMIGCNKKNANENIDKQKKEKKEVAKEPNKNHIFILHSYHEEMGWVQEINSGIAKAIRKHLGSDLKTKYFYMDTKRNTSEEWKKKSAAKAIEAIKAFNPYVVIVADDNATNYVVGQKMRNTKYQFVFLGVNAKPSKYGFPAPNVTGFLEHENLINTANLLKEIDPRIEKVVFLADKSPSTEGLEQRVNKERENIDVEIINVKRVPDFETWKKYVKEYQSKCDSFIFGHYHTLKGKDGKTVPSTKVMEWTLKNNKIPEASFWAFSINEGALCSITVSGFQHGFQATKQALEIIKTGAKAGDTKIKVIHKGEQMVNTARAKQLGLSIPQSVLRRSKVVNKQDVLD